MSKTKSTKIPTLPKRRPPKQSIGNTKNHRFETFSERVARIDIKPTRTKDSRALSGNDQNESYFQSAFELWKDRNLSANFGQFVSQVEPLCQSFPQQLLHKDAIFELLYKSIAANDKYSLEPLLNLLAEHAHDLGMLFRPYFKRCFQQLLTIASNNLDVEVIEWTFNCIAWLFKYLSKLLLPDLITIYDLVAPLLGRQRQREFITKFAGDALSYLLRKCASPSSGKLDALQGLMSHAIDDFTNCPDERRYQYSGGLALLLLGSVRGVKGDLNSNATAIFRTFMIETTKSLNRHQNHKKEIFLLAEHFMIEILSSTNIEASRRIADIVVETITNERAETREISFELSLRLLYPCIVLRKEGIVSDWDKIWDTIIKNVRPLDNRATTRFLEENDEILCKIACGTVLYSPLVIAAQRSGKLFDKISSSGWHRHFLTVCQLIANESQERWFEIVLPGFRRFILAHWSNNREALSVLILNVPTMDTSRNSLLLDLPHLWIEEMLDTMTSLAQPQQVETLMLQQKIELLNAYLKILLKADPAVTLPRHLQDKILAATRDFLLSHAAQSKVKELHELAVGPALRLFSTFKLASSDIHKLLPSVINLASTHGRRLPYLDAISSCLTLLKKENSVRPQLKADLLIEVLLQNLTAVSHDLRLTSLELLLLIHELFEDEAPLGLNNALEIEQSKFSLDQSRAISMKVEELAASYRNVLFGTVLSRASLLIAPLYCFGILHVQLSPVWDDACRALEVMIASKIAEEVVLNQILSWLKTSTDALETPTQKIPEPATNGLRRSDFAPQGLRRLEDDFATATSNFGMPLSIIARLWQQDCQQEQLDSNLNRSRALLVLQRLPSLAEKKSRQLVPLLLDAFQHSDSVLSTDGETGSEDETLASDTTLNSYSGKWLRREQKQMLEIFSQFKNPKSVYKADFLYRTLLEALCHGDNEIQKAALKAMLQWNEPSLRKYQDHLFDLLDDAKFREEVTTFFALDAEEDATAADGRRELIPTALRILYGRAISRNKSKTLQKGGQPRRRAILTLLAQFEDREVDFFVELTLGALAHQSALADLQVDKATSMGTAKVPVRNQIGMLNMCCDIVTTIPNRILNSLQAIIDAVIYCHACSRNILERNAKHASLLEGPYQAQSDLKYVRQQSLHCLQLLFERFSNYVWEPRMPLILNEIMSPKLENFETENSQGVSALLRIFSAWSNSATLWSYLTSYEDLSRKIALCLAHQSTQTPVKRFILTEIVHNLTIQLRKQHLEEGAQEPRTTFCCPATHCLVEIFSEPIAKLISTEIDKNCLEDALNTAEDLCYSCLMHFNARKTFDSCLKLLREPPKVVSPHLKSRTLVLMTILVERHGLSGNLEFGEKALEVLSRLYSYFKDYQNRTQLLGLLKSISWENERLQEAIKLSEKLLSFSKSRLDEPDFPKRFEAFRTIQTSHRDFSSEQWRLLVATATFLVSEREELSMRSAACSCIRQFLQITDFSTMSSAENTDIIKQIIAPSIQNSFREPSELVCAEHLSILAEIVETDWAPAADMKCLLRQHGDDSFFDSILHLQQHRRIRALHWLSGSVHMISQRNVVSFFYPLVSRFLNEESETDHNLLNEALHTLTHVSRALSWKDYRLRLEQATGAIGKLDSKIKIRKLGVLVNALYSVRATHVDHIGQDGNTKTAVASDDKATSLSKSLPAVEVLGDFLSKTILPTLMDCLHFREDSTVDLRLLLAVPVCKIILCLPSGTVESTIIPLLMDISNVLKSKAQEARDSARKALAEITTLIGPSHFHFVVKQLKSVLQKGSQRHVLAYTIHSLLVTATQKFASGQLDHCIPDIMTVVIEDVFGSVGLEKESQDYKSQMKEVKKKSLSYDSVEILSSACHPGAVTKILLPIQQQLERSRPRSDKVDALLTRVRQGLLRNINSDRLEILAVCFGILQNSIISTGARFEMTSKSHTIVAFTLDFLSKIFNKHEVLKTVENLEGLMPYLRVPLTSMVEEVEVPAYRLLASIAKLPLRLFNERGSEFLRSACEAIERASSLKDALAQSALRFLTVTLRDRPDVILREIVFKKYIARIITLIKSELREPADHGDRNHQTAALQFVRAVLGRGILLDEVYEAMDIVREVMLTSQEHSTQELCRSAYSRFILDYFPVGSQGATAQIQFIIQNLQYPSEAGRKSTMEILSFILEKASGQILETAATMAFYPLCVSLIADESEACREMSRALLGKVFIKAGDSNLKLFKRSMNQWLDTDAEAPLVKAAFAAWIVFLEMFSDDEATALALLTVVQRHVKAGAASSLDEESHVRDALELLLKITKDYPEIAFGSKQSRLWDNIFHLLHAQSVKIRIIANRLCGSLFTEVARNAVNQGKALETPAYTSSGLTLTEVQCSKIVESARGILELEYEDAREQGVKNLVFVGRVSSSKGPGGSTGALINTCTFEIRQEIVQQSLHLEIACAKVLIGLVKGLPSDELSPFSYGILRSITHIDDTQSTRPAPRQTVDLEKDELVSAARDIASLLHEKLGASEFLALSQRVHARADEKREERRSKRHIEKVSHPEKVEIKRRKKHGRQKVKRQMKNAVARGKRRGW